MSTTSSHEVAGYPGWWPEVRETQQLDEDRITLRTRSLLPYDITFTLTREVADPVAHVLQARLRGSPCCGAARRSPARCSGPITH